jgi:hypothetical protein
VNSYLIGAVINTDRNQWAKNIDVGHHIQYLSTALRPCFASSFRLNLTPGGWKMKKKMWRIETVPLGDLKIGLETLLAKPDPSFPQPDGPCGFLYVQKLLDEADRLFGRLEHPHIRCFWDGYQQITDAGGYQLDGESSNGGTVTGDLFANGALPGTVHITPYRTIDRTASPAEAAAAQGRYAYRALHETLHLARQGGYTDEQLARAACSLANVPPPNYSPTDIFMWSGRFDDLLQQHFPALES